MRSGVGSPFGRIADFASVVTAAAPATATPVKNLRRSTLFEWDVFFVMTRGPPSSSRERVRRRREALAGAAIPREIAGERYQRGGSGANTNSVKRGGGRARELVGKCDGQRFV